MSIGLSNTKLSFSKMGEFRLSKVKKAAPSIAEKAIFIPKPKKRVKFKMNTGNNSHQTILNEDRKLGANGLTASLGASEYKGEGRDKYVKVELVQQASKDFSFTPTQEEGRQINHHEIHFTQQYDTYGRPRIGFSREPYDFAATKYIQVTSDIRFQENMSKSKEHFKQFVTVDLFGDDSKEAEYIPMLGQGNQSEETPQVGFGNGEEQEIGVRFLGNHTEKSQEGEESSPPLNTLGDESFELNDESRKTGQKEDTSYEELFFRPKNFKSEEDGRYVKNAGTLLTGENSLKESDLISIKI